MNIVSTYKVKIKVASIVFDETVRLYRKAVEFFIDVINHRWESDFSLCRNQNDAIRLAERLCHSTAKRPSVEFDFSQIFYKFPSYLRRSAIAQAYGTVSSYRSRLGLWKANPQGLVASPRPLFASLRRHRPSQNLPAPYSSPPGQARHRAEPRPPSGG